MGNLHTLLEELATVVAHPRTSIDKYLAQGKKIVGCFPIYTPEELVHAAGMVPIGIWGGQVVPSIAGQYAPIFTCSIMRSCLEFGMTGKYQGLSAAIMPMLCDTFRGMSGAWRVGVKDIPLISFIHPQNRTNAASREFLAAEYGEVKKQLEAIAGHSITEEDMARSIDVYNRHHAVLRQFLVLANDHLDVIAPRVRHTVMKSAHLMEKAEHTAIVAKIVEELAKMPKHEWKGKKVILTGITGEPNELLDLFAENKIAVVGDDLAQESRQIRVDIPEGGTSLERLAQQWLDRSACSTVHESESTRGRLLVEMAQQTGAQGIVICLMKFCDVEEYDYPLIVQAAEAAGLMNLCLDIDQGTTTDEQARTKIQSFAEMM
jgi:benzoyl-CoA reductase/2-hydroxyglutaryl-CoA dehydratase subunit BcrC/BadD/HgdB